jgi:hypothetical protein
MQTAQMGKAGLLWIGEKFYPTPQDFDREGAALGLSRRIAAIPRGFKIGETWILLAHPKTVRKLVTPDEVPTDRTTTEGTLLETGVEVAYTPGIFKVWRPSRIEKLFRESDRDSQDVKDATERGITPVFVPDNDKDHQGTVYDKDEEEEATLAEKGA